MTIKTKKEEGEAGEMKEQEEQRKKEEEEQEVREPVVKTFLTSLDSNEHSLISVSAIIVLHVWFAYILYRDMSYVTSNSINILTCVIPDCDVFKNRNNALFIIHYYITST